MTFLHAPTAPDVNRADAPIADTAYAGSPTADIAYVGTQSPEDNQGTMSSNADIRTVTEDDMLIITGQDGTKKRYRCPVCGHEMGTNNVKRHLKSKKHSLPQFPCVCGGKFTRKDSLRYHKKNCRKVIETWNVHSTYFE